MLLDRISRGLSRKFFKNSLTPGRPVKFGKTPADFDNLGKIRGPVRNSLL
jgi:hypothetical protein